MVTFKDKTPKKDNNQGMHTYEGSEVANIGIGQNGFDVIADAGDFIEEDTAITTTGSNDCIGNWTRGWVAIKVVGGAACQVEGTSNVGADLTDGTAVDGSSGIYIQDTDTIYGNFKKVLLQTKGSNSILVCYRG